MLQRWRREVYDVPGVVQKSRSFFLKGMHNNKPRRVFAVLNRTGLDEIVDNDKLGGGFKYFLLWTLLGEMILFDKHIFQMGWWSHQVTVKYVQKWMKWSSLRILIDDCPSNCMITPLKIHLKKSPNIEKENHLPRPPFVASMFMFLGVR